MKRILISLFLIVMIAPLAAFSQSLQLTDSLSVIRNQNIKYMLDLRFRGGAGEFERQLIAAVDYPDMARRECVVGVVILSFNVSCSNELGDFRMRNPLGHGFNEKLNAFFVSTEGHWNACSDDRYTRFEIPVAFTLSGTETNARGFITVEGENPGYKCRSDQHYLDRYERYMEKGRKRKALEMIDVLVRRDPLNNTYTKLKREILNDNE
jgi:hypothetical protein